MRSMLLPLLVAVFAMTAAAPLQAAVPPTPGEPAFFAGNPATHRLAFRYRTGLRVLGPAAARTGVWGEFGQTSFWYLDDEARGYTVETIYAPAVTLFLEARHLRRHARWWPALLDLTLGYSHHSNGVDGPLSRSWNHVDFGLTYGAGRRRAWSAELLAWVPFNVESDNPDLAAHAGHGRLSLIWTPRRGPASRSRTEGRLSLIASPDASGFVTRVEASLSHTPGWLGRAPFAGPQPPYAFFVQWVKGTGESLIDYRRRQDTVRLGLRLW